MKNLTKLAFLAAIAGGAYYLVKTLTAEEPAAVPADNDDLFEGDFETGETAEAEEAAAGKFATYKQKASEIAKKAGEKASELGKKVAAKAGEAKDFVEKKVEELKKKDAADELTDAIDEAAEQVEDTAGDAAEFVGDAVDEFKPVEDPEDPEA